jgi:hypothetical protein
MQRSRRSGWVETKGIEPSTPALQRWTIALTRASTSNNVHAERHSVLMDLVVGPRFVSRAVSRRRGKPSAQGRDHPGRSDERDWAAQLRASKRSLILRVPSAACGSKCRQHLDQGRSYSTGRRVPVPESTAPGRGHPQGPARPPASRPSRCEAPRACPAIPPRARRAAARRRPPRPRRGLPRRGHGREACPYVR